MSPQPTTNAPPAKLVATVIWFAILFGVFVIQFVVGGGFSAFSGEMQVKSAPLMAVGLLPLVVGVIGRMVVIPGARNDTDFIRRLIICLAVCETPVFIGLFALPPEYAAEKTFAFVGSVLGLLILFPITIKYGKEALGQAGNTDPYHRQS